MHLERFAQYWDDMDDWYWVLALKLHKVRRVIRVLAQAPAAAAAVLTGIMLATVKPPAALALAVLMFVTLLYRAATTPPRLAERMT